MWDIFKVVFDVIPSCHARRYVCLSEFLRVLFGFSGFTLRY